MKWRKTMNSEEYIKKAATFRLPSADNKDYLYLGFMEELGELSGKLSKRIRDTNFDITLFEKEVGDVLWFLANIIDFKTKNGEIQTPFAIDLFQKFKPYSNDIPDYDVVVGIARLFDSWINTDCNFGYLQSILHYLDTLRNRHSNKSFQEIAEQNIAKLEDRKSRNAIKGNGDER